MNTILTLTVAVAALVAAFFWLWASMIKVTGRVDTIVDELQRIGRLNAFGAVAASVGAICASAVWLLERLGS